MPITQRQQITVVRNAKRTNSAAIWTTLVAWSTIPIRTQRMAVKGTAIIVVVIVLPVMFHCSIMAELKNIIFQTKPTNIIYLILYFLQVFIPFGFPQK